MQTYKDFTPSNWDSHITLDELESWLVLPTTKNRDEDTLGLSNFESALELLGGESETVRVCRFDHWAIGWFEIILVDPVDVDKVAIACEIESSLNAYPVLNEDHWSELEYNTAFKCWQRLSIRERVEYCQMYGASIFAARRGDKLPNDYTGELIPALAN